MPTTFGSSSDPKRSEPAGADQDQDASRPRIDTELGSAFDIDQMFGAYEDGRVFEYRDFQSRDVAQMLERDGKARTIEQVLTLPIMGAGWQIKAAKGDAGEAEFVTEALTRKALAGGMSTPMDLVIAQAAAGALYRKAFFEKVFTLHKGKVVYDKLAHRPVTTCEVARDPKTAEFLGYRQYPYRPAGFLPEDLTQDVDWIDIPRKRSWVHIHGQHRDPLTGVSEMSVPLWCHTTKQKLRYLWYVFLEVQALPKGIVSHQDINTARETARDVAKLKNNGVLAKRNDTTLEPYESTGRGSQEFQAALRWLDGEMAQSVLAGFTGLTEQQQGSYALSSDQSDFFLMSRKAAARELQTGITHWVVGDLVKYNFGPDAAAPDFEFGELSETDVSTALTTLTSLSGQTDSVLPAEFVLKLAEKAATYLDMNEQKVRDALERAAERAEERAKAGDMQAKASAETAANQALLEGTGKLADQVRKTKEGGDGAQRGSGTGTSGVNGAGATTTQTRRRTSA